MLDEILTHIRTKEEAVEFSQEIDMLLEALYEKDAEGFNSILKHKVRFWVGDLIKRGLETETDAEGYLKKLQEEISEVKEFGLTLAFEPTEDALERFSNFVKQNVGNNVILRISHDPHIIGGAVIIYEGEYRDFSFKKVFENEFETSRSEIFKSLEKAERSVEQQNANSGSYSGN